jgi:cell division septal protein FtsQ
MSFQSALAKRLSIMERELRYEAQQQELSAVGPLVGLSLLLLIGLGVVVVLVLLALT